MVGPEAAASAGASGYARRCPSVMRSLLAQRPQVGLRSRAVEAGTLAVVRGGEGAPLGKRSAAAWCRGWAGLGLLGTGTFLRLLGGDREGKERTLRWRLRSCFPPGAFEEGYSEVVLTGKHL